MTIAPRLRAALLASGAGLVIALGFPDSVGLWPLRLLTGWPGEIGRGIGALLFAGKLGPLALSEAGNFAAGGSPGTRALVAALGLAVQLATAVALFRLAPRPQGRVVLFALAAAAAIAALIPPAASAVSAAELGAWIGLLLLALWKDDAAPQLGLQFLAGVMITAPLAELRPMLLSLGAASGDVGILEAATGLPAAVWAVLATGAAGAALAALTMDKPVKVRPT